ncbi:transposase [Roseibium sp.]|uniref:transposase n=1 Tax=Roseibium sp. TaxID=1936156 RepID=UPI003B514082
MIVGTVHRRYWSYAEKVSILEEVGVYGASVSNVARRHALTRKHVYQWRTQLWRKGLLTSSCDDPVFVALPEPIEFPCETFAPTAADERV